MNVQDIEKIIREYITKTPHMSLATVKDDKPWVCEVHFVYDIDLNLYFISDASRRHSEEIAANPHVAGNIVRQHALAEAPKGIYFEGRAATIEATDEDITRYCTALGGEVAQVKTLLQGGHSMYKIAVRNWAIFGDFDGGGGTKQVLAWK